jgi:hypothetical protein
MQWDRSNAIGLAKASCTWCEGRGVRQVRRGTETPCNCVYRAVFRACYNRFRECAEGAHMGTVSLEFCRGSEGRRMYSRKREEFMADFCLISQRTLDEFEQRVFRYHFLLGADWKLCCRQMKLERGVFFHHIYRIQQKLGRAFAETEPYALYPLRDYFSAVVQKARVSSSRSADGAPFIELPLSA